MKIKLLAVISTLAILLSGCSSKDDVIDLPSQPKGYQELLAAYNSGSYFLKAVKSEGVTTITFEDLTVPINDKDLYVHDHSTTVKPDISLSTSNHMWIINGQLSGIKDYSNLSDEQASPVYVWFDKETLHMVISNGHQLDYPFHEKPSARSFTLPVVRLTTAGAENVTSKEIYIEGSITITDPDKIYSEETSVSSDMKIRGRGNSTWTMFPKKPYRIKLTDKRSLLGMPASKNWCLLANYADKSLLRNLLAMKLSSICSMSWTPRMVSVEVYLNNSYLGVYNLCEHKEVSKNKVNIELVEEADEDITGGYYLEIDEMVDAENYFYTGKGVPITFSDPEEPTPAQMDYVKKYFEDFESALFGSNFKDEQEGYAKYIDIDSFINNYIVQELSKNVDGNIRRSTFLTKERDKKLEIYHVWDFDLAFGNADYFDSAVGNGPTGWWIKDYGPYGKRSGWYYRLFEDPGFVSKLKDRWNELKSDFEEIPDFIDLSAEELQDGPAKNFKKWDILGKYVWPNVKVTGSYEKEVEYLKDFYSQRLSWLDGKINSL